MKGRKVIIVGAGIGGLAAATALARQGAMVTVLEQAEAITEAGAGIQVSPNGFAVLRALGLAQEACDLSTKASGVCLYDYQRGPVLPLDMAGGQYRLFHRADLIDLLHWAARRAGVRVLLLQKVPIWWSVPMGCIRCCGRRSTATKSRFSRARWRGGR